MAWQTAICRARQMPSGQGNPPISYPPKCCFFNRLARMEKLFLWTK